MGNLRMPSFDEFLECMGEDKIAEWFESANDIPETMKIVDPLVDSMSVNRYTNALCAMSYKITVAMMKDYHAWLTEQLSQRSLHLL